MSPIGKLVCTVGIVCMYLGITFSVPLLSFFTSTSSAGNRAAIVETFSQTDITPLFYTFEGNETPLFRHMVDSIEAPTADVRAVLDLQTLLPVLNSAPLKKCAAQYVTGSVAYLQTGNRDEYPKAAEVTEALAAGKALLHDVPDCDIVWDKLVAGVTKRVYPPEQFFPYLNSDHFDHERDFEYFSKAMRNFTPESIVFRFGGMLLFFFGMMSLCSVSTKKGMKFTGSALQVGGVLAVVGPAIAYLFLKRSGGDHVVTETLYYGRFFMNIFKPVIKTAGLTGILSIVSGAALESTARRLLKRDAIDDDIFDEDDDIVDGDDER